MPADYEASAVATVVATAAVLPVAVLPVIASTVRRYGRLRGWPMIAAGGLLVSTIALAAYTVLPLPTRSELSCTRGRLSDYWITSPRDSIAPFLRVLEDDGLVAMVGSGAFAQFFLNILLFVPFGFFLHHVTRWNAIAVTAVGFLASAAIEVTQGTGFFRIYPCPYRIFDVADILANTSGALGGAVLSAAIVAAVPAATPRPVPDLDPPSLGRRGLAWAIDVSLTGILAVGAVGVITVDRGLSDGRDEALRVVADGGSWALALLASGFLVLLLHPLVRRDRATPGQVVVNIGPARAADPTRPAAAWQALVRGAVRGAALALLAIAPIAAVLVVVAEIAVAAVTHGGSSLAGLAARTVTRTAPALDADRSASLTRNPG